MHVIVANIDLHSTGVLSCTASLAGLHGNPTGYIGYIIAADIPLV